MAERLGRVSGTPAVGFLDGRAAARVVLPRRTGGARRWLPTRSHSSATHDFGTTGEWKRITVSCGSATIDANYRPADEAGS
jgi:hypothetical protein